jgi:predicted TIM-barrel fold metal-dependent hydrolase
MVWGSDWPHVHFSKPMMHTGGLLDLVARWAPDEAVRHRILVDNPARLYGF